MKIFLTFNPDLHLLSQARPQPLHLVGGATILDHILFQLADLIDQCSTLILPLDAQAESHQIKAWVEQHYPQLPVQFMPTNSKSELEIVWGCRAALETEESIFLASGNRILIGPLEEMPQKHSALCVLEDVMVGTGAYWFQSGQSLLESIQAVLAQGGRELKDIWSYLQQMGTKAVTVKPDHWLEVRSSADLIHANHYLLSLGYGSDEAIERSYIDGFTVLAPVHVHSDAQIDASVIGPYTSIGANAVIRNSVISESIVERDALVENCILDHALIGQNAQVIGQIHRLIVKDKSIVQVTENNRE